MEGARGDGVPFDLTNAESISSPTDPLALHLSSTTPQPSTTLLPQTIDPSFPASYSLFPPPLISVTHSQSKPSFAERGIELDGEEEAIDCGEVAFQGLGAEG